MAADITARCHCHRRTERGHVPLGSGRVPYGIVGPRTPQRPFEDEANVAAGPKGSTPMSSLELTGRDMVVRYSARDKTLLVRSKDLPASDEETFSDVHASATDIGQTITVVLLESS